jgi:ABC-2 type transport system ATP-binding protein
MALTADHLVVIGQGRLMADTSMADFIHQNSRSYVRMRSPEQERLLDVLQGEGIKAVGVANGSLEVDGVPADRLGELAARERLVLHELSPQQASLEEAFMQLTAESVEYHAHDGEPVAASPAAARAPVGAGPLPGPPGPPGGAPEQSGAPAPGGWGADWQRKKGD